MANWRCACSDRTLSVVPCCLGRRSHLPRMTWAARGWDWICRPGSDVRTNELVQLEAIQPYESKSLRSRDNRQQVHVDTVASTSKMSIIENQNDNTDTVHR